MPRRRTQTTWPLAFEPLMIAMVGLPARGKTYVARKVERYLQWRGFRVRGFNIGEQRRKRLGGRQDAEFFNPDNEEGQRLIRLLATEVLDQAFDWLREGGGIAIFDATNTSRERRELVLERCAVEKVRTMFIEVVRHDVNIVDETIRATKLALPDYAGMTAEQSLADFHRRIRFYERVYSSLEPGEVPFIQWIDGGERIVFNRIDHELDRVIGRYVSNLSSVPAPVWLTRHGQSEYNLSGRIGGDASLTPAGREYATRLFEYVRTREAEVGPLAVWSSTLRRSRETASHFPEVRSWRDLDEIDAGMCEEMTYAEIGELFSGIAAARKKDKFRYRYPRGESYEDLILRLDTVALVLERMKQGTLIVGHQAVLRVIYAYLTGVPPERCPHLDMPLHTVIELSPRVHDYEERRIALGDVPVSGSSG